MFLADLEYPLRPWQLLFEIGVVDLVTVKLLHLCLRYEAALEAEALFCQVLAAVVADLLLCDAFSLLAPVPHDLCFGGFLRIKSLASCIGSVDLVRLCSLLVLLAASSPKGKGWLRFQPWAVSQLRVLEVRDVSVFVERLGSVSWACL